MTDPFRAGGEWLRCALHAHTTNSDGELAPPVLVSHYERAGYDVLATTDHWVRTDVPGTERLVVLPSTELNAAVEGRDAHVLAFGIAADPVHPAPGEPAYPPLQEIVDWIRGAGGVAFLAHPYWSGVRSSQFEDVEGLSGLEVYNTGCELEAGTGVSCVHWDEALAAGRSLLGIATDDSHYPGFDSGFASTWVRASARTPEAVLAALRDGAFYASTGPELRDVAVDGRTFEVRSTPAQAVRLVCGPERGSAISAWRLGYNHLGEVLERDGAGLVVHARLVAPRSAPYARVEVHDGRGGVAWANPVRF